MRLANIIQAAIACPLMLASVHSAHNGDPWLSISLLVAAAFILFADSLFASDGVSPPVGEDASDPATSWETADDPVI